MSEIICVTNRTLCCEDFLNRIEKICASYPHSIVLREKMLDAVEYEALAEQVLSVCRSYAVPCTLHSFTEIAVRLGADRIHLPMHLLRELQENRQHFHIIGASVHSVEEAQEAEMLGASYLTAGHIFATDCKKGLAGRGLTFLEEVCRSVQIPVYAIGGITGENYTDIQNAGAAGACIMSGLMQCEDVQTYLQTFEESL